MQDPRPINMKPLFSIITITYNAGDTVERTLKSIDYQSFTDYEHLIVDGASSDSTLQIISEYKNPRRFLISEPDKGIYDAMNKGLSNTSGKYLIFLNAGDKFHAPNTLETIAKAISDNEMPGIIYGQTDIVDNDGNRLGPRHLTAPKNLNLKSFSQGMLVCHQAFVALRRITGKYNLKYKFSADFDWCIQCLQHSRKNVGLHDTVLVDYLNEGTTTRNRFRSLLERFRIMCYYYGILPTAARHATFVARALKRKL